MQCDVHANPGDSASYAPFLVNVQADLLAGLHTRTVIPLVAAGSFGRRAQTPHLSHRKITVVIVRVVHGAREYEAILFPDD